MKSERVDRLEFRKKLKATKYANDKGQIESLALDEDGNNKGGSNEV